MSRLWRLFKWARSHGRRTGFDALFAVSFVVFLGGIATLAWGLLVSDASAVPGLGIVCIVAGGYACSVFGFQGAKAEQRSVPGSLAAGFRQIWHWIRPPR